MGILDKQDDAFNRFNTWFADTRVGKYFEVQDRKSALTTELRAGTVTFLTVRQVVEARAVVALESLLQGAFRLGSAHGAACNMGNRAARLIASPCAHTII